MSPLEYQTLDPATAPSGMDWREWLKRLGPLVGLTFVILVFTILTPSVFLSAFNLRILLVNTAVVGTAALGMTIIIISGGIDLSVGSNVALCSVMIAILLKAGLNPIIAAAGGILVGASVGLLIGFLVTGLQISPFIATLGLMAVLRGAAKEAADNGVLYPPTALKNSWIARLLNLNMQHWWAIIPAGVWLTIILALFVAGMLRFTKFGRHVFAIGSNEQTARLCGVNVVRTKVMIYVIAAALVGVAALLHFSYLYEGDPTSANGLELDVIAAVVIGGASLNGGEGTILGSMAGALMMSAVANGCGAMGWPNSRQEIFTGAIIIVAAALDRLRHRKTT